MSQKSWITGIHHVSLSVSDVDRSVAFYQLLGFTVQSDRRNLCSEYLREVTGYPDAVMDVAFLSGYSVMLELLHYHVPQGVDLDKANYHTGSAHLCFETSDLQAEYLRLREFGFVFRSPPVAIREGPNAGRGAAYFFDPDGYTMELAGPFAGEDSP